MCENSMKYMTFHVIKPMGLHWETWNLTLPIVFEELYPSSDGVWRSAMVQTNLESSNLNDGTKM